MIEKAGQQDPQELRIQELLDRFLRYQAANNNAAVENHHLDEDSLAAFVEGNLGEREAQPVISHLVDCSFCRHVTAELVRLDMAFSEEETPVSVAASEQPSKISEVLNGLLSRIFGTNDGVVFAHHETEEEKPEDAETTEDSKN